MEPEIQKTQHEEEGAIPIPRSLAAAVLSVSAVIGLGMAITAANPLGAHSPVAESALAGQAAARALPDAFANLDIEARSAIVVDLVTDKVLFSKNIDDQLPLASITKVMTIDVVAPFLTEGAKITISHEAVVRGEGGGPDWGEIWRARELMDYTLIASSNVGAEALAQAADPLIRAKFPDAPIDSSATVWLMNQRAREWGLMQTYFLNVSGLDIGATTSGAYGSARDIANLFARVATTESDLYAATTQSDARLAAINGKWRNAANTNEALPNIPGLIMGKTGSTDLAGGNLGIVFDAGPSHPVVIVVLGASLKGRFTDVEMLAESARKAVSTSH